MERHYSDQEVADMAEEAYKLLQSQENQHGQTLYTQRMSQLLARITWETQARTQGA